jgi:hypothetical protein
MRSVFVVLCLRLVSSPMLPQFSKQRSRAATGGLQFCPDSKWDQEHYRSRIGAVLDDNLLPVRRGIFAQSLRIPGLRDARENSIDISGCHQHVVIAGNVSNFNQPVPSDVVHGIDDVLVGCYNGIQEFRLRLSI